LAKNSATYFMDGPKAVVYLWATTKRPLENDKPWKQHCRSLHPFGHYKRCPSE